MTLSVVLQLSRGNMDGHAGGLLYTLWVMAGGVIAVAGLYGWFDRFDVG